MGYIRPIKNRARGELGRYLALLPDCVMEDGILKQVTETKILPLSNFLPVPLEEIVCDDGRSQERFFRIKGLKEGTAGVVELAAVLVKASSLAGMNWVTECWGFEASIAPPIQTRKDYLRAVIFTLGAKTAVRRTVFTHTGWRKIDGAYCFLYNGGAIGCDHVSVELDSRLKAYDLSAESIPFWKSVETVMRLFQISKEAVIYPLVALAFLSPLNEFLRQSGHEPAFLLFLLGRTQTRKSTLAALMLSFFGPFTSTTLPASFKDTENAIEKKAHALKDVLTVIDDYHPVTHYRERQNMEKIAQALARGYGDRTGKDRMQADTSIRQGYAPRGNAVITGEDFPEIGQSGSARNFIVELQAGDVPAGADLDFVQEQAERGVLAAFMRAYITWLIPQAEQLPSLLKSRFLELRRKAIAEQVSGFGRTGDIIAWLQTGMEQLMDFLVASKVLTPAAGEKQKEKAWSAFCGLSGVQREKSEEDHPTSMFLGALKELLESGKAYVRNYPEPNETPPERSGMIGYLEDDRYYLLPGDTYAAVVQFYRQQDVSFPLSRTRLFKLMAAENRIEIEVSGQVKSYTRQKRFGKEKGRYLVIPKAVLYGE